MVYCLDTSLEFAQPVVEVTKEDRYLALLGQFNNLSRELETSRRNEEKLGRLLEEANQENDLLNEYIATIAHEMNNPLHVASSYITYLMDEKIGFNTEIQQDYLYAATCGIKQTQVLLQDLLCDSQLIRQQLDVDLKPVDLRKIVREAFNQFKLLCRNSHLELVGSGLNGPVCMVLGSEKRLQQALFNLLTNAIKFSPEGSEIQVKLSLQNEDYLVEVIDQGQGISPENQTRIFERRYQVKESSGIYRAGYGLGLSITLALVELMGGAIGVESEQDRGSRFWFTLPAVTEEIGGIGF